MTVIAGRVDVEISAELIAAGPPSDSKGAIWSYVVKNVTGTAPIFLGGGPAVTVINGFEWVVADGPLTIDLQAGEDLYGIVDEVTQTCHTMRTEKP